MNYRERKKKLVEEVRKSRREMVERNVDKIIELTKEGHHDLAGLNKAGLILMLGLAEHQHGCWCQNLRPSFKNDEHQSTD